MISKKKFIKIIDIIYWTIIILIVALKIFNDFKTGNININDEIPTSMGIREYANGLVSILFIIFMYTVFAILKTFYITILYIGIRLAYKKYNKEKLNKIDIKNDSYYRDIISTYSPGVLSYIDDFKLDEKDIAATLISLELKRKIKIDNQVKIVDATSNNLEKNEKYILEKIIQNKTKEINFIDFEEKIIEDCIENDLIVERSEIEKKLKKKKTVVICIYIILIFLFFSSPELLFSNTFMSNGILSFISIVSITVIFLLLISLPFIANVYFKSYKLMNDLNPYIRNKKGNDINLKLEGLKKYIKEYSLLNEKEHNDIVIWEDYLIYSIIFGQNKDMVEKIIKIIKSN